MLRKQRRDKSVADFKKFREGERAKGTRHDHILDKWQQKKIAAKSKKAAGEAVDSASALSAKQQDTERISKCKLLVMKLTLIVKRH